MYNDVEGCYYTNKNGADEILKRLMCVRKVEHQRFNNVCYYHDGVFWSIYSFFQNGFRIPNIKADR